jgi:DNA-binding CsgD family transcriptional regulator
MPEHEIVGRGEAVGAIGPFLDRVAESGGALVLEGGPGIGKTTLWREAVARAGARGWTVLACHPVAAEAKLAFASLADLFEPLADELLPQLPEPQRLAFAVALMRGFPVGAPPSPRAVATAVLSALRSLSETTVVVLAIDDQQWLDRTSAAALAFALRRLGPRPVGMIVAERVEHEPRCDPLSLEAAFDGRLERQRLGPLSSSALHHVIRLRLGHVFPRPTLRRITDTSGGNPFFALELARALVESEGQPGPGAPLPVPDTLSSLMTRRLERLPSRTRQMLLLAAVTPAPTVELLERAIGQPEVDDALDHARRAHVVELHEGRIRFTHPLLAATVESGASTTARRAAHARLATLVATPEQRARHLAFAAAGPDEAVARELDAAAILARRRGAPEAAAELQEQAARLTPPHDGASRRRRRIHAAEHAFHAGDRAQARAFAEAVLGDEPSSHDRSQALHVLGKLSGQEDAFAEAIARLEEALAHCDDPRTRMTIRLDLAHVVYHASDVRRAFDVLGDTVEEAERLGDSGLIAIALAMQVLGRFMAGLGSDPVGMARALALEDRTHDCQMLLRPTAIAGMLAVYEARVADAERLLREICDWARERGEESGIPFLLFNRSRIAWLQGDLARAVALADEALLLTQQIGSDRFRTLALLHRSRAHATRGDLNEARADLATAGALIEQTGHVQAIPWLLASAGLLALTEGDAGAAEQALAPLVAHVEASGVREPMQAYFLPDAIEALIRLGQLERADALLEGFARRAIEFDRPWASANVARCRSALALARGQLDPALASAEDSTRGWAALGMPIERGRALLLLGQVRRHRREHALARQTFEEARDLFASLGALPWTERATDELQRVPIRRRATDHLTPTEESVARLAASGQTNQQVAKALFLSPKTVEAHLSRVYAKLGIRSRAELGARMPARHAGSARPDLKK